MSDPVFAALRNNTFTVARRTRTSDGQGGFSLSYVVIGSVLGRIRPASSAEIERAALEKREITHVLYVLPSADIVRGDMVASSGLVVDVLGIREPSLADHHLEIDCVERQKEEQEEAGT